MGAQKVCLDKTLLMALQEVGVINQLATTQIENQLGRELGVSEFGVLGHLDRSNDAMSPSDLAARFQVTKSTMSGVLCKLESKQYVLIETLADDLRRKEVRITDKGREVFRRHEDHVARSGSGIVETFGSERLERMLGDLEALRTLMVRLVETGEDAGA